MFGPGLTQALALQLCDYAEKMARPGAPSSKVIPLTPPSKLFNKRKHDDSPSLPASADPRASADTTKSSKHARSNSKK